MLLHELLVNSARANPNKTALVSGGKDWTYGDLNQASDAFAGALLQKGFHLGDRLGICTGNTVETVVGIFGALKAGGAFVLVNPAVKRNKLVYILSNASCAAIMSPGERLGEDPEAFLDAVPSVRQAYLTNGWGGTPRLHSYHDAVKNSAVFRPPAVVDADLAALIYTSGSTGIPKGTVLTHLNMVSAARSISSYLEIRPEDVVLNVLPVSFDYGLYQILLMFMVGGTAVLTDPFSYPQDIVKAIREHGVTGLPCVPPMFGLLSRLGGNQSRDIPTLRFITNTGAAPGVKEILKVRELFPDVRLYLMYGLTECKRVSYLPPEEVDRRPGSVGKSMPNVGVRILKENGEEAAPGETGELVVRGSNVMQGYWEDPEATSRALRPGRFPWEKELYTGDLFRTDEEGFLYFLGRKDDIIKIRGEKVSPKEIENVILGLDGVREVVVVGVPDDVLGQAIHAHVVQAEPGILNVDQVREHCARNLEHSSVPRAVFFHKAIPRNTSGKVDMALLSGPDRK